LSQANEDIDLFSLAEEAGLSLFRALESIAALDDDGLLDRRKLRLTLVGLSVAATLARAAGLEMAPLKTRSQPVAPLRRIRAA
jgi:hypothetical protein